MDGGNWSLGFIWWMLSCNIWMASFFSIPFYLFSLFFVSIFSLSHLYLLFSFPSFSFTSFSSIFSKLFSFLHCWLKKLFSLFLSLYYLLHRPYSFSFSVYGESSWWWKCLPVKSSWKQTRTKTWSVATGSSGKTLQQITGFFWILLS